MLDLIVYFTITTVSFCINLYLLYLVRSLQSKNRTLEFDIKVKDCEITSLKTKIIDKQKPQPSAEILQILSELNSGGSLLKIERVDQNNLFQWHPTDRN